LSAVVDGCTTRQHLENIYRQTGRKPIDLENELPDFHAQVWADFLSLNSKRTSNGFGHNPITNLEIRAWCELYHITLPLSDIDLINRLDNEYLKYQASQAESKK